MQVFDLSEVQADYILDMALRRLTRFSRIELEKEKEELERRMLSAEAEIAAKFVEAAKTYGSSPAALHLRAMNIIYETTKERGATILMPTSMVDSMSVALPAAIMAEGGLAGKPA